MPDFGIFRGFGSKLFSDRLYAGQLPTQLGLIGSESFGTDVDALAFFDRVTNAGGVLSATEKLAIDTLVKQMKTDGIWSKMKAIYPMVGASAAACAQNLKSSSFTGTFNGGWTFGTTGIKGNGTSGYLDTQLNAFVQCGTSDVHFSIYFREKPTTTTYHGTFSVSPAFRSLGLSPRASDTYFDAGNANGIRVQPYDVGLHLVTRFNSTSKAIINSIVKNSRTNTLDIPSLNSWIGALNGDNSPSLYSSNEIAFSSIGQNLTDGESDYFYTAVQAFQTTLGRQV